MSEQSQNKKIKVWYTTNYRSKKTTAGTRKPHTTMKAWTPIVAEGSSSGAGRGQQQDPAQTPLSGWGHISYGVSP